MLFKALFIVLNNWKQAKGSTREGIAERFTVLVKYYGAIKLWLCNNMGNNYHAVLNENKAEF